MAEIADGAPKAIDVETYVDVEVDWIVLDELGRRFTHGKTRVDAVAKAKQSMLDVMEVRSELEAIGKPSSRPLSTPASVIEVRRTVTTLVEVLEKSEFWS